jgi:hypothetical protein
MIVGAGLVPAPTVSAENSLDSDGPTAAIKEALARTTLLKSKLNPIVRNKYSADPASLAAWKSANHVEKPPKPKTKNAPPPPPPVK